VSTVESRGEAVLGAQPVAAPVDRVRPAIGSAYGRRDFLARRLLLAADMLALVIALAVAAHTTSRPATGEFLLVGVAALPAWAVLFQLYGLYHRGLKRVSHSVLDDLPPLLHTVLVGSLGMWALYRLAMPSDQLVLVEIVAFATVAILGVLASRSLVRPLVARRMGRERTLLIGDGAAIDPILRKIRAHPEYRLAPVGRLATGPNGHRRFALPVLGSFDDFERVAAEYGVERIIVSHTDMGEAALLELLRLAKPLGIKVSVLPQMFDVMGPSVEVDDVEGVTILGINPPILSRSSRALKRGMDILGASALVIFTAPLMALISVAIKLDSRGPALHRQLRVGKGDRRFQLLKFRTMTVGAEAQTEQLMSQSKDAYWLLLEDDPRITRVGRLLRKTSLDELPQLVNVLRGDMSLVGPRPLIEDEDCQIDGWARCRLDLMPGITGWWQVLGRTNIPFDEMVKLDYLYVTNWSLWTDVRLILKTLPAVLTRRGAN
jgi:exopolysaccharide biosynthesis polyprenyl glycosylphosphotransferase